MNEKLKVTVFSSYFGVLIHVCKELTVYGDVMEDSSVAVNSRCQQLLTYRVVDIYIQLSIMWRYEV